MSWWTKIIRDGVPQVERHENKMDAAIALLFAGTMAGIREEYLGLYRVDPTKHEDAENLLPRELDKSQRRKSRIV